MGKAHVEAARKFNSAEYVGVVDMNQEAAQNFGHEYNLEVFAELADAIEKTKPQAADICVPTPYHLELIKICAEHGIHVLCEKPISRTAEDAKKIKDISEKGSIRLMIAQVLRFWPEYVCAREKVLSGEFGKIVSIDCKRLSSPPAWNSWMMLPDIGGGAAIDLQIHDMDFVLQLMGAPIKIDSVGRIEKGAVNAVFNRLIYSNAVPVTIEASYLMPLSYPFRMYFKIDCEEATLEMDFWRSKEERLKIYPKDGNAYVPEFAHLDDYGEEIRYFAEKLLSGENFEAVPLDDSITALKMCLASEKSCMQNKTVELER